MKKEFLNKIKDARLLSKEESKTISGGYGGYEIVTCGLPRCVHGWYPLNIGCDIPAYMGSLGGGRYGKCLSY
ncbi:hypothetical protein D1815_09315 [Aquimarina sp. AD1]|uniref:hypothetical protein n=1 Tax=Aquimarina sp. (strain AD1) TaxID=1714848 RepID=UPI000E48295E|nr:hypothetical protein [Aquimarina sp. AD1]AXT55941.1 hypothetical protein D1815_09315 [Aquimarina sp. AD1]RKN37696.1 hypothetical protein D7035_00060 [Aquimarina sp. AD1]